MNTLENYAMKILADSGCDCYTYGDMYAKHLLDDLKEAYPDGMEYPYVDVANAIYAISRPRPIVRAPYHVHWDTDNCCDACDCESFEQAKEEALDILLEWMAEAQYSWRSDTPTQEQAESWDYMIYSCGVSVARYDPWTDTYDTIWEPSQDELDEIGWTTLLDD